MAAYEYKNVKVEIRNGIAWTMLNRPEKRNALSVELLQGLLAALSSLPSQNLLRGQLHASDRSLIATAELRVEPVGKPLKP